MNVRKHISTFCLILSILFLISLAPAFACPACISFISIIPIPAALGMVGALAVSALMYDRHRALTLILFVGFYIALVLATCGIWALWHQELKLLASLPFLIILNLVYLFSGVESEKFARVFSGATVGIVLIGITLIMQMAGTSRFLFFGNFTGCQSNLKNIGTAMEMYAVDNNRKYPDTLAQVSPDYITRLPRCYDYEVSDRTEEYVKKMYGKTFDDYKYTVSADHERYTMWCPGENHQSGVGHSGYPQYNSEQGLISGR